jgi:phospho-N-acetylmuramoyl-pentapeptide-transferase
VNSICFVTFAVAALAAIFVGPDVIRMLTKLKVRQTISEDAPERHKSKQGTPTMGGLIIFAGILIGGIAGLLIERPASYEVAAIWATVLLAVSNMALGFLDDYLIAVRGKNLGLKARHKLLGQFVTAIAFVAFMAHIDSSIFTLVRLPGGICVDFKSAYYPLAVLLIVGMSNAVNLTDGLDGLVGGLTTIVGISLGIFLIYMHMWLGLVCWAIAGGCIGFLWHNSYPASVFMGDTGSLGLGALLGGIAIASKEEIVVLLICTIFIIEALSVTLQVLSFKTTGKRIFKMAPIHHHFELCGWPEQKIVIRFWIVQALISCCVLVQAFCWVTK